MSDRHGVGGILPESARHGYRGVGHVKPFLLGPAFASAITLCPDEVCEPWQFGITQ
jgi:hypothetical protein